MLEFHRRLRSDIPAANTSTGKSPLAPGSGIGAAQALRHAVLKLLSDGRYRHPFYWAGFEVLGNAR
jgi:hypothetical protein